MRSLKEPIKVMYLMAGMLLVPLLFEWLLPQTFWEKTGLKKFGYANLLPEKKESDPKVEKVDVALQTFYRGDLPIDTLLMPRKIDTTSQHILLTGDSMSEGLMFAFREYAKKNKHKLTTKIWYSSSTETWSQSDTLSDLIKRFKPDYVFFTLGSNELFIRDIKTKRAPFVEDIVKQGNKTKFIWIGPPNWKDDTGINDLIASYLPEDQFFVSKGIKMDRISDGAHPTRASSRMWADTISKWIVQKSRYPIKLEK